jgi:hypothetical protein
MNETRRGQAVTCDRAQLESAYRGPSHSESFPSLSGIRDHALTGQEPRATICLQRQGGMGRGAANTIVETVNVASVCHCAGERPFVASLR